VKKILLADDSITIQKVVELTFSEGDYQVICVSNGAQALRRIPEVKPDVVLLDVIMPEKNGYEVCEAIKRSPETSGIPVLLLTGTFEPFDKKRAEASGAQGHLTKPFESQALVSKVEELIASRPTVVSREEAGAMDVISGGDIYRVDGSGSRDGLRPSPPPLVPASLGAPTVPPGGPGLETRPEAPPAPAARTEPEENPEAGWSHPALAAPEAGSGGAYVGFADLGIGSEESEIVPDRFDDGGKAAPPPPAPTTSTVRLNRSEMFRGDTFGESDAPGQGQEDAPVAPIEGLTGAFEVPEPSRSSPRATPDPESDWTPPPEAPPAETWQASDEEVNLSPAPAPAPETAPFRAAIHSADPSSAGGNGGMGITPEAIDLIAERVVARLSDRVVREIAWEVIPQVAEALVRRRIKELEEGEGG
jgi:CheY-like chemotaxis protein